MVVLLSEAKKIRLVSDIKSVFFNKRTPEIISENPEYAYIFKNIENSIDPNVLGQYPLLPSEQKWRKVVDGIVSGIRNHSDSTFYWVAQLLEDREGNSCCPADDAAVALLFRIVTDLSTAIDPKMVTIMSILKRYYYGGKDIGFQGKRDCWLYIILPVLYAVRVTPGALNEV